MERAMGIEPDAPRSRNDLRRVSRSWSLAILLEANNLASSGFACRLLPPRQFSKYMHRNEFRSQGRGVHTRNHNFDDYLTFWVREIR